MPKSEPKNPSTVPKENQPPGAPVAQCPKDKQLTLTSETEEQDLPNRSRTRIGVGETVTLKATPGPATWTVASGAGVLSSTSGESVRFTASEDAGSAQISAAANGCQASITFSVVAPSGVVMKRKPGTRKSHTKGKPSTGMIVDVYVQPADVSFRNVTFREREAYAVGTGWFEEYFRTHQVGHHPNPDSWSVEGVDPALGSKFRGGDRIEAHADSVGAGTITWSIPWEYTVGSALFPHTFPSPVVQVASFTANGTATVSKGGESTSSNLNDSSEKDPLFP
jgi:hypothetical protein